MLYIDVVRELLQELFGQLVQLLIDEEGGESQEVSHLFLPLQYSYRTNLNSDSISNYRRNMQEIWRKNFG